MNIFTVLVVFLAGLNLTSTQYYGNDYDSAAAYTPQPSPKSEDIEQKYVNSGQSVLLVCDLPNSMPDGKVSIHFYCFLLLLKISILKY
jgi:hypothetical protein